MKIKYVFTFYAGVLCYSQFWYSCSILKKPPLAICNFDFNHIEKKTIRTLTEPFEFRGTQVKEPCSTWYTTRKQWIWTNCNYFRFISRLACETSGLFDGNQIVQTFAFISCDFNKSHKFIKNPSFSADNTSVSSTFVNQHSYVVWLTH